MTYRSSPMRHSLGERCFAGVCDFKAAFLRCMTGIWFPYDRQTVSIVLQPSPFFPNLYLIFQFIIIKNGVNKKSIWKFVDELIDEVLSLENFMNDINAKFSKLTDPFSSFQVKYEMISSNLLISRCYNDLLLECITQNAITWITLNIIEEKPLPSDSVNALEQSVCQVLSLTGISIEPDNHVIAWERSIALS